MLSLLLSALSFQNTFLNTVDVPGNIRFDPLQLANTKFLSAPTDNAFFNYREAEIKHGRFAMLAAVAYPLQENLHPIIATKLDLPNKLSSQNISPSLVNGNFDMPSFVLFLALASFLEITKTSTTFPADYDWRITKYDDETPEFFALQNGEIWNGRLAMIAVVGYVVQEFISKMPVIS